MQPLLAQGSCTVEYKQLHIYVYTVQCSGHMQSVWFCSAQPKPIC
jgi:hypothetical protein